MKSYLYKLIILANFLLWVQYSNAQVGINIADPDTRAVLQIHHDTKGVLLPAIDDTAAVDKVNGSFFYSTADNKFYYYRESDNSWQCLNPLSSTGPDTARLEGNMGITGTLQVTGDAGFHSNVSVDELTTLNNLRVDGAVQSNLKLEAKNIQITKNGVARDMLRRAAPNSEVVFVGNTADSLFLETKAGTDVHHVKGSETHVLWDSSNDGASSTLDADLLDGTELATINENINKQANARTTDMKDDLGHQGPRDGFPSDLEFYCYVYKRNGIVYLQGGISLKGNTAYDRAVELHPYTFPDDSWRPVMDDWRFPVAGVTEPIKQMGYGRIRYVSGEVRLYLYVHHSDIYAFFNLTYPVKE